MLKHLILFLIAVPSLLNGNLQDFHKTSSGSFPADDYIVRMAYDPYGFPWIATRSSIERLDGNAFRCIDQSACKKIFEGNNKINDIGFIGNHTMIICTDEGLFEYGTRSKKLEFPGSLAGYHILSILKFNSDSEAVLLNTSAGLYEYNILNHTAEQLSDSANPSSQNLNKRPRSAAVDKDGNIWVCEDALTYIQLDSTANSGLRKFNINSVRTTVNLDNQYEIAIDKFDNVWIYGSRQTYVSSISDILEGKPLSEIDPELTAVGFNGNDLLLGIRGKGNEIVRRDDKGEIIEVYQIMANMQRDDLGNTTNAFLCDKGGIWIGTRDGLYRINKSDSRQFHNLANRIDNPKSLSHNTVNDIHIMDDGTAYVGTSYGLNHIVFKDKEKQEYTVNNYLPLVEGRSSAPVNKIECLLESDPEILWVGTKKDLLFFDCRTHRFYQNKTMNSVLGDSRFVRALFQDRHKNVWIGFQNGGVYYFDNISKGTFRVPIVCGNTILDECNCITGDKDDNIWIGTMKNGLFRMRSPFNPSISLEHFEFKSAEGKELMVTDVFVDLYNTIWCSTESGLYRFNDEKGRFEDVPVSGNQSDTYLSSIIDDDKGALWLASETGIYKFSPSDNRCRFFELNDKRFSRRAFTYGMAKDKEGYIYCSGISGLTYFDPSRIIDNQEKGPLIFSDFCINSKSCIFDENELQDDINDSDHIVLKHSQNNISFTFCNPGGPSDNSILYSYFLEGYDKDWIVADAGNTRITYNKIPTGRYNLHIKSNTYSKPENGQELNLGITVKPVFFLSWYMILAYLVLGISIASLLIRQIRIRKEIEKESEINESRKKFYKDIAYNLRTPYSILQAPLEKIKKDGKDLSSEELDKLIETASKGSNLLYMLMEQLVAFSEIDQGDAKLDESEVDFIPFLRNITEAFNGLYSSKGINLIFKSSINKLPLVCDKNKMENIFFNLLSNSYKFTDKGGKVEIQVSSDTKDTVTVSISDTGCGIAPENIDKVFDSFWVNDAKNSGTGVGLPITKSLIELHGGSISVKSRIGEGSTFIVNLPVRHDVSFDKESISENVSQSLGEYIRALDVDTKSSKYSRPGAKLIYIVEKDNHICSLLEKLFSPEFMCESFSCPEDALESMKKSKPSLIISGAVFLKKMQGLEFCKIIKGSEQTAAISFLFLTGYKNSEFEKNAFANGADAYISKPFEMEYLKMRSRLLIQSKINIHKDAKKEIISAPKELQLISSDDKFLRRMNNILEKNISNENFDVSGFAKELSISQSMLHRKLKTLTGKTPNDQIKDFRLKRAAQLLKSKAYNISEIAYKVGFSDVKYFSTCFKKEYGVTPSAFQKEDNE